MELRTMGDLGTWVRELRRRKGLTQTDVAHLMGVTQSWVSRLERGNPRLEAQLVLDAFAVLGSPLQTGDVTQDVPPGVRRDTGQVEKPGREALVQGEDDPFRDVFEDLDSQ